MYPYVVLHLMIFRPFDLEIRSLLKLKKKNGTITMVLLRYICEISVIIYF